jgi:hypothetical protein
MVVKVVGEWKAVACSVWKALDRLRMVLPARRWRVDKGPNLYTRRREKGKAAHQSLLTQDQRPTAKGRLRRIGRPEAAVQEKMRLRDLEMGDSQVKSADNDGVVRLARNRFVAGLPRIRSRSSYRRVPKLGRYSR